MNEETDIERYYNLPKVKRLGWDLNPGNLGQNLYSQAPHLTTSPENPPQMTLKSSILIKYYIEKAHQTKRNLQYKKGELDISKFRERWKLLFVCYYSPNNNH